MKRISVAMNTRNEEPNIRGSLSSVVPWVDEIIVVDMMSNDRTVDIARELGADVHLTEPIGYVEPARQIALDMCTGEWVLVLDADEVVPVELARRLREIAERDLADAVIIPWKNYLIGGELRNTGWGCHQDMHMRFIKRNCWGVDGHIHTDPRVPNGSRVLHLDPAVYFVHHFNYHDFSHFIEKLNRYTEIEADQLYSSGVRKGELRAFLSAFYDFYSRYVKRGGYRDGWRGFYLSLMMSFYRIVTYAKLRQLHEVGSRADIANLYKTISDAVIEGHMRT